MMRIKPKIAIAGSSGRLGSRVALLSPDLYDIVSLEKEAFDIINKDTVDRVMDQLVSMNVRTLINCAGNLNVDELEKEKGNKESIMYKTNVIGAGNLANSCKQNNIKLIHISSEYVFEGKKELGEKYKEEDKTNSDISSDLTWYGITKSLGEKKVLDAYEKGVAVIRFCQIQSPTAGIFFATLNNLRKNNNFTRASNQIISVLSDVTAVNALWQIEQAMHTKEFSGIIHVSSTDALSAYQTSLLLAKRYGFGQLADRLIEPLTIQEIVSRGEQKAVRPLHSVLDVSKFRKKFNDNTLHSVSEEIEIFHSLYPYAAF